MPRQRQQQGPGAIDIGNIPAQIQAARQRRILAPRLSGPTAVPKLSPTPDIQTKNNQRIQDQADYFQTMEASNKLEKKARELVYNQETGLINKRGKDSFTSEQDFKTSMASVEVSAYGNLTSNAQREMFAKKKDSIMNGYLNTLNQHVRAERRNWEKQEYESYKKLRLENIADNSNDPTVVNDIVQETLVEINKFTEKMGMGFEASELALKQAADDAYTTVFKKNLEELNLDPATLEEARETEKDIQVLRENFTRMKKAAIPLSPNLQREYAKKIRESVDKNLVNTGVFEQIRDNNLYEMVDNAELGQAISKVNDLYDLNYQEAKEGETPAEIARYADVNERVKNKAISVLRKRAAVNSGIQTQNKQNSIAEVNEFLVELEENPGAPGSVEKIFEKNNKLPRSQQPHFTLKERKAYQRLEIMTKNQIPIHTDPKILRDILSNMEGGNYGLARDIYLRNVDKLALGTRQFLEGRFGSVKKGRKKEARRLHDYKPSTDVKTNINASVDDFKIRFPTLKGLKINQGKFSTRLVNIVRDGLRDKNGTEPSSKEIQDYLNSPEGIKMSKNEVDLFVMDEFKNHVNNIAKQDLDIVLVEVLALPDIPIGSRSEVKSYIPFIKSGKMDLLKLIDINPEFKEYDSYKEYRRKNLKDKKIMHDFIRDFYLEYYEKKGLL